MDSVLTVFVSSAAGFGEELIRTWVGWTSLCPVQPILLHYFSEGKMTYQKYPESSEEGKRSEESFRKLAEGKGYSVSVASKEQNIEEHWDLEIQKDGESYKVDVKAPKRNSRGDMNVQSEFIWVEFRSVQGKPGWLYGKADLIAFQIEIDGEFWLVKRTSLVELVDKLVDKSQVVTNNQDALYKIYTRTNFGKPDQTSKIHTEKLIPIIWQRWTASPPLSA